MDLQKIFLSEKKAKTKEVYKKYTDKIDKAAPEARLKAAIRYLSELNKEIQDIFSQNIDLQSYYFYVQEFAKGRFAEYSGLYNNFQDEFEEAKQMVLKDYDGHEFLPKVNQFLGQGDELIIKKIAHYFAYNIANIQLTELKDKIVANVNISGDQNKETSNSSDVGAKNNDDTLGKIKKKNQKTEPKDFKDLFRTVEAYNTFLDIIDSLFLNENEVWIGDKDRLQEVGAFIDLLRDKNYISFYSNSRVNAINLFSKQYSIQGSLSGMRKKDYAYNDFLEKFRDEIPMWVPTPK